LTPDIQIQLVRLRILLDPITLIAGNDIPIWDWNKSGQFSAKSVYKDLSSYGIDRSFKHLWKANIPLKIKIWLWLIWHNAIATKDTMTERGWLGNPMCQFCNQNETIHHLFFPILLPNLFGVVWQDPLVPIPGQGTSANFSGGFPNIILPVGMYIF
jgi:hypothetical protein